MTEITIDNFEEQLPTIVKHIRDADFIAIDCEFTGLVTHSKYSSKFFDSPAERYQKLHNTATNCSVLQFGLAAFQQAPRDNRYEANYYSFFTCPRNITDSLGPRFVMDTFSLEFLNEFGFDFNKCIRQGIPFMNRSKAEIMKEKIQDEDFIEDIVYDATFREDQVSDIMDSITRFSRSLLDVDGDKASQTMIPFKSSVNQMKNFAILSFLRTRYPFFSIRQLNGHILVRKPESEEEIETMKDSYLTDLDEVMNYMIGVSKVVQVLIEVKKPIIGHNMFPDLMFIYQSFVDQLPRDLDTFKKQLSITFPLIYDTKNIFVNNRRSIRVLKDIRGNSNLFKLYQTTSSQEFQNVFTNLPVIELSSHENVIVEPEVVAQHDAGADAFMTGCLLVKILHAMICTQKQSNNLRTFWQEQILKALPYQNKINLMGASNHSLNLAGKDGPSDRPPWLFIRCKTGPVDCDELKRQFKRFGRVDFEQTSRATAMMAAGNEMTASEVLTYMEDDDEHVLAMYNKWKHNKLFRTIRLSTYFGAAAVSVFLILKLVKN